MQVIFKRFDTTLPIPEYKTAGAAAFDLYARQETKIEPQSIGYIPLNVAIQLPKDHWALLSARSSLHKRGLMLANGIGVGDYDYRGPNDEYMAAVFNFTKKAVVIEKAERVVQLIVLKREVAQLIEQSDFTTQDRGGFGSTGKK